MTTPALDPSPKNELGKGIFAPGEEAELLAFGYIFAAAVPDTLVGTMVVCKRRIADAVTDGSIDSLRVRRATVPASAPAAPVPQAVIAT